MRALRTFAATLWVMGLVAFPGDVLPQAAYPEKPIKILVPFLPGGSVDLVIRLVSHDLSPRLGKPIVVENRAGAGGVIAADFVAKAPPDGYTLLFTAPGPLVTTPFLLKQMPYDAQTAFAPVSLVTSTPNVVTANPQAPFRTVADFVSYAKANPEKLTYGSPGIGTIGHLAGVLMNERIGLRLVHVPYKGFPPLLTDVKAGRITLMITEAINSVPRIRSGELIAIAVAAPRRSPRLPDVPTFAESGYAGVVAESWYALVAPAGTPGPIRTRLADEIRAVLRQPGVAARLEDLGVEVRGTTPEELGDYLRSEYRRWGDSIRAAGITPE